jgi:small subunit ribosomal protein S6
MAKQHQHLYEGMYILSAALTEDARHKILEKITASITTRTGEVCKVFDQGRRKLAYEVDGRREGHYYVIYFTVPSTAVMGIWKEYRLNEDLLRFITLRAEEVPEKLEFKNMMQQ